MEETQSVYRKMRKKIFNKNFQKIPSEISLKTQ